MEFASTLIIDVKFQNCEKIKCLLFQVLSLWIYKVIRAEGIIIYRNMIEVLEYEENPDIQETGNEKGHRRIKSY